MLKDGFRDDIDAIVEFLPKKPKRQTFLFGEKQTYALKQMASRLLVSDHHVVNPTPNVQRTKHADIAQYNTILPNASHQIPYLMKLIAHDQMTHPAKSKVVIYLPTTRMTQLFSNLVRQLRATCFPAGDQTNVYEVHSLIPFLERPKAVDDLHQDKSGASVLLTTDLTSRNTKFYGITRVIQFGIPSSDPVYFNRLACVSRASKKTGRCDSVLLPWEMGYLTWHLMDVPFTPLTVKELDTQLLELSETVSSTKDVHPAVRTWVNSASSSIVALIESAVKSFLPQLGEESIRGTFVSILGYYVMKSREIRAQQSVIVQGVKDWATGACGLRRPPYVSDAFLTRLGDHGGRKKRPGHAHNTSRWTRPQ